MTEYFTIILSIAGLNYALISWLKSDMQRFQSEIHSWKEEINKEMKDFHGRLCKIEERKQNDTNSSHN